MESGFAFFPACAAAHQHIRIGYTMIVFRSYSEHTHTHAYNDDDDSGVCINLMYHAIKINYAYICFSFFLLLSDK